MQIETARLKKYLRISEIMHRMAKEQRWTELWALQNERNSLMPEGIERFDESWGPEETELANKIMALDNLTQTEIQNASEDVHSDQSKDARYP